MLTNNEMHSIEGGRVNWSIISFVSAAVALIAGIIDGFLRPSSCKVK